MTEHCSTSAIVFERSLPLLNEHELLKTWESETTDKKEIFKSHRDSNAL